MLDAQKARARAGAGLPSMETSRAEARCPDFHTASLAWNAFPLANCSPLDFGVSRSHVFLSPSCLIPSLLVCSRLASVKANRQFPINIYIAFLFYFLARLRGLGWLRKMFFHLNNVPVGGWIPAFRWAVEKSGWGGLPSPGGIKAQKPIQKLQVRVRKCIWSTHCVSAPELGLGTKD